MRKRLFGRHGAITLFLCLLLSAVILLESIYVAGAYRRKQEQVHRRYRARNEHSQTAPVADGQLS